MASHGAQRTGSGLLRLAAALGLLALAGGCALPPAVAIASYAIDVGSFVATGKTATDHGISLVAQEDCALMRVFEGPICQEDPDYQLADAGVLEPLPPEGPGGPQSGLPTPISPLAAGGDRSQLPQIVQLPGANLLPSDLQLVQGGVLTRQDLMGGATYLADGFARATPANGG